MEIWEAIAADPQTGARRLIAEYGDRLFAAAMILVQEGHGAEDLVSRRHHGVGGNDDGILVPFSPRA